MVFLNSWAFWLAGVGPAIVLLYLLKVKRRPMTVSTLLFWQRVLQENRRRALFQRLRQWLSLLLHLIIFALVLLALSRPVFDRQVRSGTSTVVVLDSRARMQAIEPNGASRFTQARAALRQMAAQVGELQQLAVLAAGATEEVTLPFTGDAELVRRAADQVRPRDEAGELASTIALGRSLLASRAGEHRLIVLTDRVPPASEKASDVDYRAFGSARENVGITQFAVRPLPSSPETSEVLLEVFNGGSSPAAGQVELLHEGRVFDVRPYRLAAGAHERFNFPFIPPAIAPSAPAGRGWLTARLPPGDALPVDDVAYAVAPSRPPTSVLLVTQGNLFLEKLLAADPRVRFELLSPEAFQPALAAQFGVIIFDDWQPAGGLASLGGNALFLGQTPFAQGAPELAQPSITEAESSHPLLRGVRFDQLKVARAEAMQLPENDGAWRWQQPLRFADRPLLIIGERRLPSSGVQRVAALGFRVLDSDLPLRVAFPLFVANAVQWLAGSDPAETPALRTGEFMMLPVGVSVLRAAAAPNPSPDENAAGETAIFQPHTNGFYRLQTPSAQTWLAVNTASTAESDLRISSSSAVDATSPPAVPRAWLPTSWRVFAGWPWWQIFAALALALCTWEWWLFHRRRTE